MKNEEVDDTSKETIKISIDSRPKNLTCRICIKTFSRKGNLKNHVKAVHDETKEHQCESCKKTFSEKGNLERHIRIVHEKRKDFQCDSCDKRFMKGVRNMHSYKSGKILIEITLPLPLMCLGKILSG